MRNYKYPSLSLKATPRHSVIGLKTSDVTTQVCATLSARDLPDDDDSKRAPADIVVALDISYSMKGNKLELCKSTLDLLLSQLSSNDCFGLITFSEDATTELIPSKVTRSFRESALAKIKSLCVQSCTNIYAAINHVAQEMQGMPQMNEVRTVFLLTDGLANRGITDVAGMCELTRNGLVQPRRAPISMHCFGYGSDHDDELLRRLSSSTPGGTYYFVQNDSDVAPCFGDALGGILSVVAQNTVLNIQVPPGPAREAGVKILDIYNENKIRLDDWNYKVTMGDLYAEETKDVMVHIALSTVDLVDPHVRFSISYSDTIEKTLIMSEWCDGHIARPNDKVLSAPDSHVLVQWLRLSAVQCMSRVSDMSKRGWYTNAREEIVRCLGSLDEHHDLQADPIVTQLRNDLEEVHRGLESSETYSRFGSHTLNMTAQSHQYQRCNRADLSKTNAYRSRTKAGMSLKFSTH
jgi:hypothetical protein